MCADITSIEALTQFAGETIAQAISSVARGKTLAPYGVSRRSGMLGVSNESKSFVEGDVVGKIDLSESVQAALQWMEDEVPRADVCMIVFDGYLNSDEGRVDAAIGRIASA